MISEINTLFAFRICLPLRKLDSQGRIVIIARSSLHNPRIHKLSDIIKVKIKTALKLRVTYISV